MRVTGGREVISKDDDGRFGLCLGFLLATEARVETALPDFSGEGVAAGFIGGGSGAVWLVDACSAAVFVSLGGAEWPAGGGCAVVFVGDGDAEWLAGDSGAAGLGNDGGAVGLVDIGSAVGFVGNGGATGPLLFIFRPSSWCFLSDLGRSFNVHFSLFNFRCCHEPLILLLCFVLFGLFWSRVIRRPLSHSGCPVRFRSMQVEESSSSWSSDRG